MDPAVILHSYEKTAGQHCFAACILSNSWKFQFIAVEVYWLARWRMTNLFSHRNRFFNLAIRKTFLKVKLSGLVLSQVTLFNTAEYQGRDWGRGASAPHFFENYKELLRKRCFQTPPPLWVTSQPTSPPFTPSTHTHTHTHTFKLAPRSLYTAFILLANAPFWKPNAFVLRLHRSVCHVLLYKTLSTSNKSNITQWFN